MTEINSKQKTDRTDLIKLESDANFENRHIVDEQSYVCFSDTTTDPAKHITLNKFTTQLNGIVFYKKKIVLWHSESRNRQTFQHK